MKNCKVVVTEYIPDSASNNSGEKSRSDYFNKLKKNYYFYYYFCEKETFGDIEMKIKLIFDEGAKDMMSIMKKDLGSEENFRISLIEMSEYYLQIPRVDFKVRSKIPVKITELDFNKFEVLMYYPMVLH